MPMDDMTISIVKGAFTLEGELVSGRKSKSGKSNLLLTSSGNQEIDGLQVNGKPVTVSVNVYTKAGA
jgi:predicted alpha/beta-hydrolase family hydrolase